MKKSRPVALLNSDVYKQIQKKTLPLSLLPFNYGQFFKIEKLKHLLKKIRGQKKGKFNDYVQIISRIKRDSKGKGKFYLDLHLFDIFHRNVVQFVCVSFGRQTNELCDQISKNHKVISRC